MINILLKKQMLEIFHNFFYDAKKNRSRSKVGIVAYIVLFVYIMVFFMGTIFTSISLLICKALAAAGMDWMYFALMGLLAILLGTFGSVFSTYSCLYLSKDNDLLLSLPIPVNVIITSRLLSVYLTGLMYSLIIILPAIIVYWCTVSTAASVILGCLLLILMISVFVMTLSCALGWLVAKISLKLKNKSLVTVVASLTFIAGYYFLYFNIQAITHELTANATVYGAKIKGIAYPLYLLGCVGTGNIFAMLAVSVVILSLFALMCVLISHSFLKIATEPESSSKKVYKETTMKKKSISIALLAKEFGHFISNPNYILNCGLGTLLLPIAGTLFLLNGGTIVSILSEAFGAQVNYTPVLLCTVVCMLASMNNITAPSVSLEGKSLWLMQSLPLTPWQVLRTKLSLQLFLTGIPVLFCTICISLIYPYSPLELLLAVLVPISYVLISALFGLYLGLKMPNLNWTNEITPIKQSACVVITLISDFVYAALLYACFILMNGWKLGFIGYMTCFGTVTLALCAVLYSWLKKRGCTLFATL